MVRTEVKISMKKKYSACLYFKLLKSDSLGTYHDIQYTLPDSLGTYHDIQYTLPDSLGTYHDIEYTLPDSFMVMVFNVSFNHILVISCRSVVNPTTIRPRRL
jgi:hypothetical protein